MMRTVGVLLDRGKKAIANAQMCTKIPRSALFGMLLLASVVLPKKVRTSNSFTQSFLSNVSWFSISPLKHVNLWDGFLPYFCQELVRISLQVLVYYHCCDAEFTFLHWSIKTKSTHYTPSPHMKKIHLTRRSKLSTFYCCKITTSLLVLPVIFEEWLEMNKKNNSGSTYWNCRYKTEIGGQMQITMWETAAWIRMAWQASEAAVPRLLQSFHVGER